MPKKQPNLQQTFTEQFPNMKLRVDKLNKGFTLRQSKLALLMLTYLQEREKRLTKQAEDAMSDADSTNAWAERLVANWNGLTDFLDEVFSLKVRGGVDLEDRSEIWVVEYPGGKSERKTMWEAYKAGIEAQKKEAHIEQ